MACLFAPPASRAAWSAPDVHGGGPAPEFGQGPDITDEQRQEIQQRLDSSAAILESLGLLPKREQGLLATHPTLDWPLRTPKLRDAGHHRLPFFVDQSPAFPGSRLDYACGARTYDTGDGYNHAGTDLVTWPFAWYRLDAGLVEVVAAAQGTILAKDDGHPDHSCVNNPFLPWNAVYLQHPDGSRSWYGHLRTGSLTPKPPGANVARGEYLGLVASSGNSSAPHLHFEVYDSTGVLNDPYQGACNGMNATSWWASQRPYYDSAINRVGTGFAPPVFPVCPNPEDPNEGVEFNPGDRVFFAAYYRDQLGGQVSSYIIRRPDGTVYDTWTHSTTSYQEASYYYWGYLNFAPSGPNGVWRFEVTFEGKSYTRQFRLTPPTGSGRVPGQFAEENPLVVSRTGSNVTLTWDRSCVGTDTDYEVYEGSIGIWNSHVPRLCSTGGLTTATITPAAGNVYYLVVPHNTVHEGSHGLNGLFAERPVGLSSCRPQVVGGNCPGCGDALVQFPEVCDGSNRNGQTCQTLGFSGGTLRCAPSCLAFDTSLCF